MAEALGIDLRDCLDAPGALNTPRKVFERKIRYWETRPVPRDTRAVASPSDSRVLMGSQEENSSLFIKGKFFSYEELLGADKVRWLEAFRGGTFAVFRLTPEKYHYNHVPVSGCVVDFYQMGGKFHSCNPAAAAAAVSALHAKNRRIVTVMDTDVPGGTGAGLVAMVEVVAMMIGRISQCYSETGYDNPRPVVPGLFLRGAVSPRAFSAPAVRQLFFSLPERPDRVFGRP